MTTEHAARTRDLPPKPAPGAQISAIVTLSVILYTVILRPSGYSLMRGGFLPEETLAKRAVIEGISAVPEEMS